jgi:hypothetical protein
VNIENMGETMREKLEAALKTVPFGIPGPVREVLYALGSEVDRLSRELAELKRSNSDDGK